MVGITVSATAVDDIDPSPTCTIASVGSNEPVDGLGDGDSAPDWLVTGPLSVDLRAERRGSGGGRVYTITIRCTDAAGNSTAAAVAVAVPRDQRR